MESLPIQIDYQRKIPLSEQIADQIWRIIHSGMIKPGDTLPTVRQLAFQLRVNFNTVARAYRILDAEGIIVTWQGRGTFVEQPREKLTEDVLPDEEAAAQLIDRLFEEASLLHIPEETIRKTLSEKFSNVSPKRHFRRHIVNRKRGRAAGKKGLLLQTRLKAFSGQTRSNVYKRPHQYRKPKNVSRETF